MTCRTIHTGGEAHGGATYCGVASLCLLRALKDVPEDVMDALKHWCLHRSYLSIIFIFKIFFILEVLLNPIKIISCLILLFDSDFSGGRTDFLSLYFSFFTYRIKNGFCFKFTN